MSWKKILLEGDAALLTSTETPATCDAGSAVIGTSTEAARADHKHSIAVDSPVALDGTASDGTSDSLARADHKHAIGTLAVNLDFGENEAVNMALENQSSNPSTSKAGRIIFNTSDNHPYVYVPS